jgi:hypothetical protein
MGKNTSAKVMAWVALIAIVSSILWTGILYMFWNKQTPKNDEIELSPEELEELQNWINSQNEEALTETWSDVLDFETLNITEELE